MKKTVVMLFDKFSDAQDAREKLISAGFAISSIKVESCWDENMVDANRSDSLQKDNNFVRRVINALKGADSQSYNTESRGVPRAGTCQLRVELDDLQKKSLAQSIMRRQGGIGVNE